MDVQYIAEVNFLIFVHTIFLLNRLWKRLYLLNVRIWDWGGTWGGGSFVYECPWKSRTRAIVGSDGMSISILEKCENVLKKNLHTFLEV